PRRSSDRSLGARPLDLRDVHAQLPGEAAGGRSRRNPSAAGEGGNGRGAPGDAIGFRLRPFPLPPVLLLPTRRRSPEAPRRRAPYPLPAIEFPSPVRRREPEAPPPPCPSASPQPAGPTPPDLRPERASGPLPPRPSPHPHREV